MIYRFSEFTFDGRVLRRQRTETTLSPQLTLALGLLLNRRALWPDDDEEAALSDEDLQFISPQNAEALEKNAAQVMSQLRHELRDASGEKKAAKGDYDYSYISEKPYRLTRSAYFADDKSGPFDGQPYLGPDSYSIDRQRDFFGREKECLDLAKRLTGSGPRIVLLCSPSGAGKTSLLEAGLRPLLHNRMLPTARVGTRTEAHGGNPFTAAAIASMEGDSRRRGRPGPMDWSTYLRRQRASTTGPMILVLDQFEEIITRPVGNLDQRRDFFIELAQAMTLEQDPSLRVLLSFRQEFLIDLRDMASHLPSFREPYELKLLSPEAAERAIRGPAKNRGVVFDDRVVTRVMDTLRRVRHVDPETGQSRSYVLDTVEPVQLQLICDSLWMRKANGAQRILDADAPDEVLQDALHDFYGRAVGLCAASVGPTSTSPFPHAFIEIAAHQFVTRYNTKRPVLLLDGYVGDLPIAMATVLERERVLRRDRRDGEHHWFELAHDTLVDPVLERMRAVTDDMLWSQFCYYIEVAAAAIENETQSIEALTRELCIALVGENEDAIEVQADSQSLQSGRLPQSLLESMVVPGIIRRLESGERVRYRLGLPRLTRVVHAKRFRTDEPFRRARESLAVRIAQWQASPQPDEYWPDGSEDVLDDALNVIKTPGLSETEGVFALRAAIASGYRLMELIEPISRNYLNKAEEVARLACEYEKDPEVRRNGARLLEVLPLEQRENLLLSLAINDVEERVRLTAANALAQLQSPLAWDLPFDLLKLSKGREDALTVLTLMRDVAPEHGRGAYAERCLTLPWRLRARLRTRLTRVRWRRVRISILIASVAALACTMASTVPVRALLATFGLTTTQLKPGGLAGLALGLFQGFVGATVWSLFIGVPLLVWWFCIEGRHPWTGKHSLTVGAIGGTLGGLTISMAMLLVPNGVALNTIHWLPTATSPLSTAFTISRVAFVMPIFGAFVGAGVGYAAQRLFPWWKKSGVRSHVAVAKSERFRDTALTAAQSWSILVWMGVAVVVGWLLLATAPPVVGMARPAISISVLIGEATSVAFGGLGLIGGLFAGLHVLRKGVTISGGEA